MVATFRRLTLRLVLQMLIFACVSGFSMQRGPTPKLSPTPIIDISMATATVVFTLCCPGLAIANDGADIANGSVLFEKNCAGCHRGGANYIRESKTLQKDALDKYLSLDQPVVQNFVQNKLPHNVLPFKQDLSDQDYKDVTTYVLDQALGNKWKTL